MTKLTTDLYWECACDEGYIHEKSQAHCSQCKCDRHDCPDARRDEVCAAIGITEEKLFEWENKAELQKDALRKEIVNLAIAKGAAEAQKVFFYTSDCYISGNHPYLKKLCECVAFLEEQMNKLYGELDALE